MIGPDYAGAMADTRADLIKIGERKIKAVSAVEASREQWEQALAARYWTLHAEGLGLRAILTRMHAELSAVFDADQLSKLGASDSTIRQAAKIHRPR
jgi:hypothetical protein